MSRDLNRIGRWPMADGARLHWHDLRRRAARALAVFAGVLAIVLAGAGLAQPGHVVHRGGALSLDVRGSDAKALRPQQQLAHREQSRSVRLGSSGGAEPFLLASRSLPLTSVQAVAEPAPRRSGSTGFLEQRTRSPREPPPPIA